jgi:hypothetical protein
MHQCLANDSNQLVFGSKGIAHWNEGGLLKGVEFEVWGLL